MADTYNNNKKKKKLESSVLLMENDWIIPTYET